MKFAKHLTLWAMIAVIIVSLLPICSSAASGTGYTSAADVEYVTVKGYVCNWGVRGEEATFLSSYAESYYTGSYTWDTLSAYDGGTGTTSAPTSELYKALQAMMKSQHKKQTSYGETRYLYCYTDCERSDHSKLTLFYSGKSISSTWDYGATWNREHTWPKSKTNYPKVENSSVNEATDIMSLRPAGVSENTSRWNTAYGESSGYYDPGASVRGDCARIMLYVYVRWGNTGYMWGKSGVMESLDVLLKWMEEDPVDTWEMGRNDAVQSITGVRNVFVDYPEYAWMLFGKEVPADVTTPSDNASGGNTEHHHSYNLKTTAPTCTEQGYTTYYCWCGESEDKDFVSPTGHSYGQWYTVTAAGCTTDGQQRRDCANCDSFETQSTGPVSHTYTSAITAPTCDQAGFTVYTCSACGHSYQTDTVAATGHSFGDWYYETQPSCASLGQERRDCTKCEKFETQPVAALEHDYIAVVTAPTCTQQGYTTNTCTSCGKTLEADYVDATGHNFGDWTIVPGGAQKSRWCSVCALQETEDLSNCQHLNTQLMDATAATCTEDGFTGKSYCNDCGVFLDMGQVIPATGHSFTEWAADLGGKNNVRSCQNCNRTESEPIACAHEHKIRKDEIEPTCSTEGFTGDIYCGDCGIFLYKGAKIPAIGNHTFGDWVTNNLTASRTCKECGYVETTVASNPEVPKKEVDYLSICAGIAVLGGGAAVVVILKKKKK